MKIFKYPLQITNTQRISTFYGAKILCVQMQNDTPCLWVLVEPIEEIEERVICMYGSGHDIEAPGEYIGTVQVNGGALVFHVFED